MAKTSLPILPNITAETATELGREMNSNVKAVMDIAVTGPDARISAVMGSIAGINAIGYVVAQAIEKRPDLTGPQIVAMIMAYQVRTAVKVREKLVKYDA